MEQFEMNFDEPRGPKEMSDAELEDAYKKAVGVSPRVGVTREMQEAGVADPEAERQRLRDEDAEDDRKDLRENYVR